MKKYLLICCLCCVPVLASAEEIDLLSDELLFGASSETNEVDINAPIEEDDEEQDDNAAVQLYGIVKPIIDFFATDEVDMPEAETTDGLSAAEETKTANDTGGLLQKLRPQKSGKKETYLARSLRRADEGDLESQMNLGYMYLYGTNGIKQDFENAFKYYSMAAKQDDPIALNNLGSLYFSGIGTEQDIRTALTLFERASDLGNDNAALNLAFIYLSGGKKDKDRNQKAVDLFQKAGKAGNKIAQFMIGYAQYKGFVLPQDAKTAFKLVRAAANGDAKIDEAQMVLAEMYLNGTGTVQNYQSAISAYRGAVNQGNIEACRILANIYEKGVITEPNAVLAHTIYNIASSLGDAEAAKKRDTLGKTMELESLKQAQEAARAYKSAPSELTQFIRQTYGTNIRHYIDINM